MHSSLGNLYLLRTERDQKDPQQTHLIFIFLNNFVSSFNGHAASHIKLINSNQCLAQKVLKRFGENQTFIRVKCFSFGKDGGELLHLFPALQ